MNFHIIREYNDSVQIQVDDLFHLWQGAIVEHFLCLTKCCQDALLV